MATDSQETPKGEHEETPHIPDMELAELKFKLTCADVEDKADYQEQLLNAIKEHKMLPFYESCCVAFETTPDAALVQELKAANEEQLKKLDDAIKDAVENLGESEIREAHTAKAVHLTRIGDKAGAVSAFRVALEKTISTGQKIDAVFYLIRLGFFYHDRELIETNLSKADELMEQGGDWDRRNRLKVYKGLYKVIAREFEEAATLFLDTISTFTASELMPYSEFVTLTVLLGVIALERRQLKEKVVDGPEIQEMLHQLPLEKRLLTSLYESSYKEFFLALAEVEGDLKRHRFLNAHARFFVRELRIKAYSQLLQSYRSVTIAHMAESFGVSSDYIDREVSRFIAVGRLNCKIDKVGGVIETTRPDFKNKQYQETLKKGDLLLNHIQKLSQSINI